MSSRRLLVSALRRAKRLWLRMYPHGVILLYHRIARLDTDPQLLCVSPEHFAEHLQVIRERGHAVRLQDMAEGLANGSVRRRSIVITFDDGYADNLYVAKPLLAEQGFPATVFVSTGLMGEEQEFWWDELDRLLLRSGTLPSQLELSIGSRIHKWDLGDACTYASESYADRCHWDVTQPTDPTPRQHLYRSLSALLQPLRNDERERVMDELRRWAGAGAQGRSTHRVLSPNEVRQMAEDGLVDIGGHTVTHPVLSQLPVAAQFAEISAGKSRLEEVLGRTLSGFSYPYGRRPDYGQDTLELVRQVGFRYACSNFRGVVRRGTSHLELPRLLVRDCDGDSFGRQIEEAFRG